MQSARRTSKMFSRRLWARTQLAFLETVFPTKSDPFHDFQKASYDGNYVGTRSDTSGPHFQWSFNAYNYNSKSIKLLYLLSLRPRPPPPLARTFTSRGVQLLAGGSRFLSSAMHAQPYGTPEVIPVRYQSCRWITSIISPSIRLSTISCSIVARTDIISTYSSVKRVNEHSISATGVDRL